MSNHYDPDKGIEEQYEALSASTSLQLSQALNRIAKLEGALEAIAANTCCVTCREAGLVAQAALEAK